MERSMLDEFAEGAIILDNFDDCIIGISEQFGEGNRIVYSKDMIIKKLSEEMSEEEALEYYDYNILGGYFGEQNPIFLAISGHPHI
jgi:hypothetical protein